MADANRSGIAYVKEVTWGTNPATQQRNLDFTSESLGFNVDNITSNSIRSDRQVTDLIQTGANCSGDINFELRYATEISDLMVGALWTTKWQGCGSPVQGTYVTTAAITVAVVATTKTWTFTGMTRPAIGQTFVLTGSGASNDGTYTCATHPSAGAITTTEDPTGDETFDASPVGTFVYNIKESITSGASASNETFAFDASANTITLGSAVNFDIAEDQWIEVAGAATGNNGYHLVTDVTGQVLTVEDVTTTETLDESDAATIKSSRLRNGTTENSYWIERYHSDVTQYFSFAGMVVNTMNMTFAANSVCTGSFGFIGKAAALAQATTGTGSNAAAGTTSYMNAVANVANIRVDDTAMTTCLIQEISFSLTNNVRGLSSIGTLGFCDIGVGELAITGNLNMYFLDDTYYDKYIASTAFSLDWKVEDGAGNAYLFRLPNCKFATDPINVTGKNSDVMENASFQAIMDGTNSYTIQICRVPA